MIGAIMKHKAMFEEYGTCLYNYCYNNSMTQPKVSRTGSLCIAEKKATQNKENELSSSRPLSFFTN